MDGSSCLIGILRVARTNRCFQKYGWFAKSTAVEVSPHQGFERIRPEARQNYQNMWSQSNILLMVISFLVKGVVIAGAAEIKQNLWISCIGLWIRDNIIAIVDVGYGHEQGFNEAIEKKTQDIIKNAKHVEEDKALQEFSQWLTQIQENSVLDPTELWLCTRTEASINCTSMRIWRLEWWLWWTRKMSLNIFSKRPNANYNQDKFRSKITNFSQWRNWWCSPSWLFAWGVRGCRHRYWR